MSENGTKAGSSGAILLLAGVVAAGAIGAGVYFGNLTGSEPEQLNPAALVAPETPEAPAQAAELLASAEKPAESETVETVALPEAGAEPEVELPEVEQTAQVPEPPETPVPPTIDEVRVEPDGLAIVAGRAKPGSTVHVLVDDVENTSVEVDAGGSFAAVTFIASSPEAQVLSITQRDGDQTVVGLEEIIIAPVAPQVAELPEAVEDTEEVVADSQEEAAEEPVETEVANAAAESSESESAEVAETPVPEEEPATTVANETAPDVGTDVAEIALGAIDAPDAPNVLLPNDTPLQTGNALGLGNEVAGDDVQLALVDPNVARSPAPLDRDTPNEPDTPSLPGGSIAAATEPETVTGELPTEVVNDVAQPSVTAEQRNQVALLRSTVDGVEVFGRAPDIQDNVSIDTISYSSVGEVQLAGRAQQDSRAIRVYLDNAPIATLEVDPDGRWRGDLPDVDTGIYRLRVDEVADDGAVTSRLETPFKREDPEVLQANDNGDVASAKRITVQTGNTLWAIARDRYGEGTLFVDIFEANHESISDPNLNFPGQVFDMPE